MKHYRILIFSLSLLFVVTSCKTQYIMKNIISFLLALSMSSALMAQTTTYRDNLGRKDGTAETKGNGSTYRDNVGRKQGSSTTKK